ncbi:MAG: alpha/beta fold hydrolase [Chloroflexota bacterium]|nr:alpha/beta fold hydrolase [Chloroflexota bacterium]
MESKFTSTPSGKIHAQVAGAGEPVLLIHGRSPDLNSWRTWERNIDALAAKRRVYALDLLGYGESDKPEPPLDARGQAKALIGLLDAVALRNEPASLVGLSWGGTIAQIVVGDAPERIDRIVLVDSGYDASGRGVARLKTITCPTLIVWDADDVVIPVAGARILGAAIPNARVRILTREERDPDADPNNRHWSQVSHSRVWNQVVAEFLSE